MNDFRQVLMGEGYRLFEKLHPSPIRALWNGRLALSRKGRGRSNARLALGPEREWIACVVIAIHPCASRATRMAATVARISSRRIP
jgi:hypothetical protein